MKKFLWESFDVSVGFILIAFAIKCGNVFLDKMISSETENLLLIGFLLVSIFAIFVSVITSFKSSIDTKIASSTPLKSSSTPLPSSTPSPLSKLSPSLSSSTEPSFSDFSFASPEVINRNVNSQISMQTEQNERDEIMRMIEQQDLL